MLMKRNDRPQYAEQIVNLLNTARAETMADAAVKYSGHLDRLAAHVTSEGLSAAEIVDLLRQESEQFSNVKFESC